MEEKAKNILWNILTNLCVAGKDDWRVGDQEGGLLGSKDRVVLDMR